MDDDNKISEYRDFIRSTNVEGNTIPDHSYEQTEERKAYDELIKKCLYRHCVKRKPSIKTADNADGRIYYSQC